MFREKQLYKVQRSLNCLSGRRSEHAEHRGGQIQKTTRSENERNRDAARHGKEVTGLWMCWKSGKILKWNSVSSRLHLASF